MVFLLKVCINWYCTVLDLFFPSCCFAHFACINNHMFCAPLHYMPEMVHSVPEVSRGVLYVVHVLDGTPHNISQGIATFGCTTAVLARLLYYLIFWGHSETWRVTEKTVTVFVKVFTPAPPPPWKNTQNTSGSKYLCVVKNRACGANCFLAGYQRCSTSKTHFVGVLPVLHLLTQNVSPPPKKKSRSITKVKSRTWRVTKKRYQGNQGIGSLEITTLVLTFGINPPLNIFLRLNSGAHRSALSFRTPCVSYYAAESTVNYFLMCST